MDFSNKLSTAEAASYLGFSKDWLLSNMRQSGIPYYQVTERRYYFLKIELDEWLSKVAKRESTPRSMSTKVKLR